MGFWQNECSSQAVLWQKFSENSYINAVFVFTSASVEAKFRSTGWADCIRDDRLLKYIVDSKFGKQLSAEEVDAVAHAFSSLARMDPDFSARAEAAADAKIASAGA